MKIEEVDFGKLSADNIYRLAKDHPAVYACVTLFRRKEITWEQMLVGLIEFLVKQNKYMFDELVKREMNRTDPIFGRLDEN